MSPPNDDCTRRKVVKSGASLATTGLLISGSASAAEDLDGQSAAEGFGMQSLTDAITIENGLAQVKESARYSKTNQISVTTSTGDTATYTARDFAKDINEGVENGYWTVTETDGDLDFTTTDKFRAMVKEHERYEFPFFGTLSHSCEGRNTIEDGVYYFDAESTEDLVNGFQRGGAAFTLAGIIVGVISAATYGPAVLAVAGVIVALGGGDALSDISDGCGIKVDRNAENEVQPQHCDCDDDSSSGGGSGSGGGGGSVCRGDICITGENDP